MLVESYTVITDLTDLMNLICIPTSLCDGRYGRTDGNSRCVRFAFARGFVFEPGSRAGAGAAKRGASDMARSSTVWHDVRHGTWDVERDRDTTRSASFARSFGLATAFVRVAARAASRENRGERGTRWGCFELYTALRRTVHSLSICTPAIHDHDPRSASTPT